MHLTITTYEQYPELAHRPPEIVKAAALQFEQGLPVEIMDEDMKNIDNSDDESSDDEPTPPRNRNRRIVWDEGVAKSDGTSAQTLHEVRLIYVCPVCARMHVHRRRIR